MATKQIPVEQVTVGQQVFVQGYLWEVMNIRFDQRGNAMRNEADMPRYCLRLQNIGHTAPVGYDVITAGVSVGGSVTVPA